MHFVPEWETWEIRGIKSKGEHAEQLQPNRFLLPLRAISCLLSVV